MNVFRREDRGSVLVESAFSAVILLMAIFSVMDLSRVLYFDHYVCYTAQEATRYAMVRGSTWNNASCTTTSTASCTATSSDVANYVRSITPLGSTSNLTVNTTWPGTTAAGGQCSSSAGANSPGCTVKVQVSYDFNFVVPLLPHNSVLLSSTAALPIAQ